jgi:type II secretory pathway pseudopilin PulG
MSRPPAVVSAPKPSKRHTDAISSIARSFEARSKYHRNAAQDTFKWIIYTGLLGIVLAILVPPLTTLVDRYVRQEVTTEELVKLRQRITHVRSQLIQAYESYSEPSKLVRNLLQQPGSFFVRAPLLDDQNQNNIYIESSWIDKNKIEYLVLRTQASSFEDNARSLSQYTVVSLSPDGNELQTIRKFSAAPNEKIWDIKINQIGIFLAVGKTIPTADNEVNVEGEARIRFLPHDTKIAPIESVVNKDIIPFRAFRTKGTKIWGTDLIFVADVKPIASEAFQFTKAVFQFESRTGKITRIVESLEPNDLYSYEPFVVGNTLIMVLDDPFATRDSHNSDFALIDLVTKKVTKVAVPQKLSESEIFVSDVFPQETTALVVFGRYYPAGNSSPRYSVGISEFDPKTQMFGDISALKIPDSKDLLRVRQLVKKSEGQYSLIGHIASGISGTMRPIICNSTKEVLKCNEYRYNKSGLDGQSPEMSHFGASFIDSFGQSSDFLDRTILVEGGYSEGSFFSRRNWNTQLVRLGKKTEFSQMIVDQSTDVSLGVANDKVVNTEVIVKRYSGALKNAEIIEKIRGDYAVLASPELSKALGATIPLYSSLREVEHVPEALPILENADATAKEKLSTDRELKESGNTGTQVQQIVTRVAVLIIFAYLLHLLVVRQRIQQVLEEHNEARFHALGLLVAQNGKSSSAMEEAKLMQDLVSFSDASLRIPPNPPAPPITKVAEAIRSVLEKSSMK